jgi:hypothetical protein
MSDQPCLCNTALTCMAAKHDELAVALKTIRTRAWRGAPPDLDEAFDVVFRTVADLELLRKEFNIVERGLAPLCPCVSSDPREEGPRQECPFHGDQDTFVAEVQRLRARNEKGAAIVQWWRRRNFSAPPPEGAALLDALARAHAGDE